MAHIEAISQSVQSGPPFKIGERQAALDEIGNQFESGVINAQHAVNRLWAFGEDEIRISRENAIYTQSIALNGESVLTSPQDGFIEGTVPAPGDPCGLVVSGNGPSNACPEARFQCFSKFDESQSFGGDDPHDSSCEISYFQARYAGIEIAENAEVNSFTFQGVGDGTIVHHLLANYTFLGNGNGDSGILFKDTSGGKIFNTIVDGFNFDGGCIEWDDAPATYDAAGTPAAPNTGVASFNGVIINCDIDFIDDDTAPYAVADFFGSAVFSNNESANPQLNGYMPANANSRALRDGVTIEHSYFDSTSYRGGFSTLDWTQGWTHRVTGTQ